MVKVNRSTFDNRVRRAHGGNFAIRAYALN